MKTLTALLLLYTVTFSAERTERFVGTAVDLNSGKLIYVEEHESYYKNGVNTGSLITYRDETNTVIGKKEITFNGRSPIAEFRREDFRFGTIESAAIAGNRIRLINKENSNAETEEELLSVPMPIAVDAGLNNLVRNHWDSLQREYNIAFNFAVPSQLDYYSFRVVKDRNESFRGRRAMVVRFESDHWYIRLFVDPVIVWYDEETRRAVKYEGISNIYNADGKSYIVRVTFDKPGP